MALFDRPQSRRGRDYVSGADAATRALSVTEVENEFVWDVYGKIAPHYTWIYGIPLHPGRLQALKRMEFRPGQTVLEVGVGTGYNAVLYPRDCVVTGIDFSASMLEIARQRLDRHGRQATRLLEMDGADLKFPDNSFDIVYAPYVISVVPDPVRVGDRVVHGTAAARLRGKWREVPG